MTAHREHSRSSRRHFVLPVQLAAILMLAAATPALALQGQPPRHNSYSERAEQRLALATLQTGEMAESSYKEALAAALESIMVDPNNANGWLIAGQASVGLRDYVAADTLLERAQQLYPGFADEVERAREVAWAGAYNRGVEAYNENRIEDAIAEFKEADRITRVYPDQLMVLGFLYQQLNRFEEAADAYFRAIEIYKRGMPANFEPERQAEWLRDRETAFLEAGRLAELLGRPQDAIEAYRGLIEAVPDHLDGKIRLAALLAEQGDSEAATAIFDEVRGAGDLDENQLFTLGVGFFQANQFEFAADAFQRLSELNPESRDVGYNLAQSLLLLVRDVQNAMADATTAADSLARRQELYNVLERLAAATEHTRRLDPYNRDVLLLQTRAYQSLSQTAPDPEVAREWSEKLVDIIEIHESLPFEVANVAVAPSGSQLALTGQVQNLASTAGTTIQLRFTLVGQGGRVAGTGTVPVTLGDVGTATEFRLEIAADGDVNGWKYELVQ